MRDDGAMTAESRFLCSRSGPPAQCLPVSAVLVDRGPSWVMGTAAGCNRTAWRRPFSVLVPVYYLDVPLTIYVPTGRAPHVLHAK